MIRAFRAAIEAMVIRLVGTLVHTLHLEHPENETQKELLAHKGGAEWP
jgi:hypothetical protein